MSTTMMTMMRITNCDADDSIIVMMRCKDTGGIPRNLCRHEDYAHGCALHMIRMTMMMISLRDTDDYITVMTVADSIEFLISICHGGHWPVHCSVEARASHQNMFWWDTLVEASVWNYDVTDMYVWTVQHTVAHTKSQMTMIQLDGQPVCASPP